MNRRHLLAAATLLVSPLARAADTKFPSQALRMVIPLAAGGLVDVVARVVADEMKKPAGVAVVADNRPGGQFIKGMQAVAEAPADGHTLGIFTVSPVTLFPTLYSDYPFHPASFQPITPLFKYHSLLAVRADAPYATLPAFLELVRRDRKPMLLGCQGRGAGNHLAVEMIASAAGLAVEPVTFANEPQANLALLSGQLPAVTGGLPGLLPHVKAGKVRLLGISAEQRIAELPDVPTYAELGFPQSSYVSWIGVFAPKSTPAPVVEALHGFITTAMRTPAFAAQMGPDMTSYERTPAQFRALIEKDFEKWGTLIRRLNLVTKLAA